MDIMAYIRRPQFKVFLLGAMIILFNQLQLNRAEQIYYRIFHPGTDKCLDIGNDPVMSLVIYDCRNNSDSQLWSIIDDDKIQSRMYPNMCINFLGEDEVTMGQCDYKSAFEPLMHKIGAANKLRFKDSSKCLDNLNENNRNLNKIIGYSCFWGASNAQYFTIQKEEIQ